MNLSEALARQFAMNRAELAEIEQQLKLYQVIADTCPLPVVLLNSHGDNVYVNKAYCEMLECQHTDLLYKGWRNFIREDHLVSLDTAWGEYVSNPEGKFVATATFVTGREQKEVDTHIFASHIPEDGFVAYIVPLNNAHIPCTNGHC